MLIGCIVIACNSGGPLESIDHEKTGFLLSPDEDLWGSQISKIINMSEEK
jgi:alpha-1,3/alpha-1,6-mannosyltransferase